MAASASAAAIFVLCHGAIFPADVVAFPFKIIFVARCAEGGVLAKGVSKRRGDDITVACAAGQFLSVVAWVISAGVMVEASGCPGVGGMAIVTLQVC